MDGVPPASAFVELPVSPASVRDGSLRRRIQQVGRALNLSASQQQPAVLQVLLSDAAAGEGSAPAAAAAGGAPGLPLVIRALGVLYDALSQLNPRTRAVPLVASAGWDAESLAAAASHAEAVIQSSSSDAARPNGSSFPPALPHQQLIVLPPPGGPHPDGGTTEQGPGQHGEQGEPVLPPQVIWPGGEQGLVAPAADAAREGGADRDALLFDHVAVGGTFDRLHCGHELLLATTALVARRRVYVGITADKLLVNKNHRELLQPYAQRDQQALGFIRATRPGLEVSSGALSDPNEPTQAELDPAMQALVVSQETLPGAARINEGRVRRGFAPLVVVVVPVIGSHDPSHKLSSTQLRARDASAAASAAPARA